MADANARLIYLDALVHHLALLSACTSRPLCNPSITIVFFRRDTGATRAGAAAVRRWETCCAGRLALSSYLHSLVATGLIRCYGSLDQDKHQTYFPSSRLGSFFSCSCSSTEVLNLSVFFATRILLHSLCGVQSDAVKCSK